MSTPVGSSQWMYSTPSGFYPYSIDQSLRFDAASESELSRTFAAGNRRKWTFSTWMKRSELTPSGNDDYIFGTNTGAANSTFMFLNWRAGDDLIVTGQSTLWLRSDRVFRDVSGWYHIVWSLDTDNATASQRMRLYVNGTELTSFSTDSRSSLTGDQAINAAVEHNFGRNPAATGYGLGAYLAETHFIDGQTLSPSDFGETINGIWVPKAYSGSYGTNGFYLDFSTDSYTDNASDPDVFADQAGSNDWNAYNLAASDVVPDSPTNNFSTFNNLYVDADSTPTYSEGNLRMDATSTSWFNSTSTFMQASGKWYAEFYISNLGTGSVIAIGTEKSSSTFLGSDSNAYGYISTTGNIWNAGTGTAYGDTFTTGDVIGVALDLDGGNVYFYKNGTIQNSGTAAATGLTGEWFVGCSTSGSSGEIRVNFGQDATFSGGKTSGSDDASDDNGQGTFYETPPSGYLALVSANLPEPTIGPNSAEQADNYFNTVLYTGNGSTQSITGVGFQPNLIWAKERSSTSGHTLLDTVRGVNLGLESNSNAVENDYPTDAQTSFDADGFSLGSNGRINESSQTYVAWNWKAGGTAVSNTDGSSTTQVSAAPDAGFSIVGITKGSGSESFGHGLGKKPDMIILKGRDKVTSWWTWHKELSNEQQSFIFLNSTDAAGANTSAWDNQAPTDEVFYQREYILNNTNTGIAYCFHSVEGFSKVGSYVGNGSTNGTFVYTGFRPAWFMLKRLTSGAGWSIFDDTRNAYNPSDAILQANTGNAEGTSYPMDFVSNGVKIRNSDSTHNQSSVSYIYLAFAEAPFKYANAR